MLRNLEVTILEEHNIFKNEFFNPEFHSVAYYFFLKLKQIKISDAHFIKINITNKAESDTINYDIRNNVLYIDLNQDFGDYLSLEKSDKIKFQCKMVYDILKKTFIRYSLYRIILDEIIEELKRNNWELEIELSKKKILKKYIYNFKVLLDTDSFTYLCIIEEGEFKKKIVLFKSIALYFSMLMFTKIKLIDNKEILIGNEQTPFFRINIDSKSFNIIEENRSFIDKNLIYKNVIGL